MALWGCHQGSAEAEALVKICQMPCQMPLPPCVLHLQALEHPGLPSLIECLSCQTPAWGCQLLLLLSPACCLLPWRPQLLWRLVGQQWTHACCWLLRPMMVLQT